MRDHNNRIAHPMQPVKQSEHLFPARLIERTGRLICKQQRRIPDKRPRNRHALLRPPESSRGL